MAGSGARILAGGNYVGFWTVNPTVTPATIGSTYVYTLTGNILSTNVDRDESSGQYSVTIEHVEDNAALQTFLAAAISSSSSAIEELLFEDGTKELGSTSSNTRYICAVRGGLQGGTVGAARKIGVFPQRVKSSSGGWVQAGEAYNRVTLECEGYKLDYAVTMASTYFTDFATTASAVTLTTSIPYGTVVFA